MVVELLEVLDVFLKRFRSRPILKPKSRGVFSLLHEALRLVLASYVLLYVT